MSKRFRGQLAALVLMVTFMTSFAMFRTSANQQHPQAGPAPVTQADDNPAEDVQYVDLTQSPLSQSIDDLPVFSRPGTLTEGFENGTKGSYAAGTVTMTSGTWFMSDALIGNLASDRKNGTKSVRMVNTGTLQMNFDRMGAGGVTIRHAVYGTDAASTWQLLYSIDGGQGWKRLGNPVTSSSTTLETVAFRVSNGMPIRFAINKLTGGSARVNIDDIEITTYVYEPGPNPTPTPNPTPSDHLAMGNPSGATNDVANFTNYLMEKPQYVLSYHRDRRTCNWVSWHLGSSDLGSTPRQDDFRADTTLPAGWYQVGSAGFGSGYDRGHMCPSADRTSSVENNSATFLMTNMVPQASDNNQGPWANLENYIRTLINAGNECYVISGVYGSNGTIAVNGMTIPTNTFKVILVLPNGTDDVNRVTNTTRVIAVNMPNVAGIRSVPWQNYRVSVDTLEALTGYDFLSNVPVSIQSSIESVVDNQ